MMCDRCDQPILLVERYEVLDILRPTGAGVTVLLHAFLCQRPPTQTSPVRRRVPVREA